MKWWLSVCALLLCMVTLTACGDRNETNISTDVSGQGSTATIAGSGPFVANVPRDTTLLIVNVHDFFGNLTAVGAAQTDGIRSSLADVVVQTQQQDNKMTVDLTRNSQQPPAGQGILDVPTSVPVSLRTMGGSGDLSFRLANVPAQEASIRNHSGSVTLRCPDGGHFMAALQDGQGAVSIEIPKGVRVEIQATDADLKLPQGYAQMQPGTFQFVPPSASAAAVHIQISNWKGTIQVKNL